MNRGTRDGFTIVEVMIAMVILAVGLLALATTSIYATTQVRVADLKTEQSLAVQEVVERMHAIPFNSVTARSSSAPDTVGSFRLWWDVQQPTTYVKRVTIYTSGPAYRNTGGWMPAKVDTFRVEIADMPVN
mgnify:CR=1 FL=1